MIFLKKVAGSAINGSGFEEKIKNTHIYSVQSIFRALHTLPIEAEKARELWQQQLGREIQCRFEGKLWYPAKSIVISEQPITITPFDQQRNWSKHVAESDQ